MSFRFTDCLFMVSLIMFPLPGIRCQTDLEREVIIDSLVVTSNVSIRFSRVSIQATLVNQASTDRDTGFIVTLPKSAFISGFTIFIDGREFKAAVKEKAEAEKEYTKAKENNVTAGYVSQQSILRDDFDRDKFNIAVNIAPRSSASFDLRYQELIERKGNVYKQKLYVNPKLPVLRLEVTLNITETNQFNKFTYRTPFNDKIIAEDLSESSDASGYYTRRLNWKPSLVEIQEHSFDEDDAFDVFYDLVPGQDGGEFVSNDEGEFVHYFSTVCDEAYVIPKRIVFVIDISGSMVNKPIEQVRSAMTMILDQLRPNEEFNIILFSGSAKFWNTGFVTASKENIELAETYLSKNLKADGATNINDAVISALRMFNGGLIVDDAAVKLYGNIIVLLSDGDPTTGETDMIKIRKNVRNRNVIKETGLLVTSLFTVAFGKNSNRDLMEKLANENGGTIKVIKERADETNYLALFDFFGDFENPYYKSVNFTFIVDNNLLLPKDNTTQSLFPLFDCGEELIVSGWSDPQLPIQPRVVAVDVDGRVVEFGTVERKRVTDTQSAMIEKLVVYKHIKELLFKIEDSLDETDEAIVERSRNEALNLALKHELVTPLTALIITAKRQKVPPASNRLIKGPSHGRPSNHLSAAADPANDDPSQINDVGLDTNAGFDITNRKSSFYPNSCPALTQSVWYTTFSMMVLVLALPTCLLP